MSNLPAKPKTADERLEALARAASNNPLLKYNSGNWTISEVPVPPGTRFILLVDQVTHQWTHFFEGKFVQEIPAVVAEDVDGDVELQIVNGKSRQDLGNHDQSLWEKDKNTGLPKDPWTYGFGLAAVNAETGAVVVFKISSKGGMDAIAGQVASHTRNRHLGYPIVTLSTSSYKNKRYGGYTSIPVFVNVGYDTPPAPVIASRGSNGHGDGGTDAKVIGERKVDDADVDIIEEDKPARANRNADMDDDIPF